MTKLNNFIFVLYRYKEKALLYQLCSRKVLYNQGLIYWHTINYTGQFRDRSMKDITPQTALDMAVKLAAQSYSIVHLYETSTLTSGEIILEINNPQFGMHKLHSAIQCAGCVLAAVLACVDDQGTTVTLDHCGHALSLYCIAAEDASVVATNDAGINPGTLRVKLIDMLNYLDENIVCRKAQIVTHHI